MIDVNKKIIKFYHLSSLTAILLWSANTLAVGVDIENNKITVSLGAEPPNLDSTLSEDTTSGFVLGLTNEGLVNIKRRGEIAPGVAEKWELGANKATFWIRRDAKWADGTSITAPDFVYSWRRLVDPKTAARGSTFFVYVLENAEAILAGDLPTSALGVKALDDFTLELTLSRPVPYLLNVLASTAYHPLNQQFIEAQKGRFGADAENMLSNGPFKIDSWIHNSSITFSRNPYYWDRENIQLEAVDIGYITSDLRSLLNVYKSKELATLGLNEEILGDASDSGFRIKKAPSNCLAWVIMNMAEGKVTANQKLRQAMRMAFDRDRYVNNIIALPGTRKVDSIFTHRLKGVGTNFQKEFPASRINFNLVQARQLLEEAKKEMGVDEIPPLVLLANESRQIEAEYIQAQLGSALGLEIKVDKQTFKQAIAKMNAGDFDIARAAYCGGALRDPVFFAGIFVSDSPFNDGKYYNAKYDELMELTHSSADPVTRMNAFGQMQQLLFEDVPIMPTHEYSFVYLEDDRVKNLMRYPVVNFSRGFIDP
jgi:oligopeptide transport system substrate-binding protein